MTVRFIIPKLFGIFAALSPFSVAADTINLDGHLIYTGYYQEDSTTNPEDPTLGSIYMVVPEQDGVFQAAMNFTFVGCQSKNVGHVVGDRRGNEMVGTWSGTVDGIDQTGQFIGEINPETQNVEGTFTVDKGKQHVSVDGCIEYFIAPNGTFHLEATSNLDSGTAENDSVRVLIGDDNITIEPARLGAFYLISIAVVQHTATKNVDTIPIIQEFSFGQDLTYKIAELLAQVENIDLGENEALVVNVITTRPPDGAVTLLHAYRTLPE